MTARLASAVVPVALLLHVLPSQAQYAYTKVARPTEEMSSIDPEETPKSLPTKSCTAWYKASKAHCQAPSTARQPHHRRHQLRRRV
ncbi:MAG: hypothetical protein JWR44_2108 [Hymenobacter sp.]|nr:hypothetical protein [Hymenobacter sp.]